VDLVLLNMKKMRFDHARTTPIGLSRYAKEFFDTAMAADDVVGMRPGYEIHAPVPVMYLVSHANELSLKAFLVFKGVDLKELASKKYGHDLEKLFGRARELGSTPLSSLNAARCKHLACLMNYTTQSNWNIL
jgi:hypothetical protein